MAYVPDQAITDSGEISKQAFRLFCFYCKHGSMKNNVVFVNLESAAKFLGIAYDNTTRLYKELRTEKWLKVENGKTILLKGWETDENVSQPAQTDENVSLTTDENISFEQTTDENISSGNEQTDENVSRKLTKTSVAYKEEPAQFNQQEKSDLSARAASSRDARAQDAEMNVIELDSLNQARINPQQIPPGSSRPSRLPDPFNLTKAMREWAVESAPDVNLKKATAEWVLFCRGAPDEKGGLSADWVSTWKKRMLAVQSAVEAGKDSGDGQMTGPKTNGATNGTNKQYRGHHKPTKDEQFADNLESIFNDPAFGFVGNAETNNRN